MKRLLIAALALSAPIAAFAGSYTFTNSTWNSSGLAHGTAYTWGLQTATNGTSISTLESTGANITGGYLTITNIYDWTVEPQDVLYVNVLNGVAAGSSSYTYDSSPATYDATYGTNYFTTHSSNSGLSYAEPTGGNVAGSLIKTVGSTGPGTFTEVNSTTPSTITIQLTAANIALLNSYLAADNGNSSTDLGLGLGPDCHFYEGGISLTLTTPDGGMTLAMLGLALVGIAACTRRSARSVAA